MAKRKTRRISWPCRSQPGVRASSASERRLVEPRGARHVRRLRALAPSGGFVPAGRRRRPARRRRRRRRGPAPAPPPGAPFGRVSLGGRLHLGRHHVAEVEPAPVGHQLLLLDAPVDLHPAQRVGEVDPAGQQVLDARRAVDLAQLVLGQQDHAQAVHVAAREGQGQRGRLARRGGLVGLLVGPQRRQLLLQVHGRVRALVLELGRVGDRHAPQRHVEGHQQRPQQQRVGEVGGRHQAGVAGVVEARQRGQQPRAALGQGAVGLGQQVGQQAQLVQHLEGGPRGALAQDLVELLQQPRRARAHDLAAQGPHRLERVRLDREAQPRGQRHRPQHAHRVFTEAHARVADRADQARVQVLEPAHVVDDREVGDVVEQRVDREVAAEGVLLGRAESVVVADQRVALVGLGLPAEGRDLHDVAAEAHVRQAEAPAHDEAVAEQALDLLRVGVRPDVEVLGLARQQEVAHAAADEVGGVAAGLQAVEDLEGVRGRSACARACARSGAGCGGACFAGYSLWGSVRKWRQRRRLGIIHQTPPGLSPGRPGARSP